MAGPKILLGAIETVIVKGRTGDQHLVARIDTGAARTSIDKKIAEELDLGPITGSKTSRNSMGRETRNLVEATLVIQNKSISVDVTLADRSHMKFPLLIGRDVLQQGFVVDVSMGE